MKKEDYLKGKTNRLIRLYFYLNSGVGILNNFRNLGLGIFALYFTLKLTNPLWLLAMAGVAVPALIIIGYFNVHKISKVSEWLNTKFSTHYSIQQFSNIEKQTRLLQDIKKDIHKLTTSK